jgi:hypothetical protein
MVRPNLCGSRKGWLVAALAFAAGLALTAPPAVADMRVVASNVAKYPRDAFLPGNTITDLKRGEWVRVRILETNKTQYFGDPPVRREGFGTRRPRRVED